MRYLVDIGYSYDLVALYVRPVFRSFNVYFCAGTANRCAVVFRAIVAKGSYRLFLACAQYVYCFEYYREDYRCQDRLGQDFRLQFYRFLLFYFLMDLLVNTFTKFAEYGDGRRTRSRSWCSRFSRVPVLYFGWWFVFSSVGVRFQTAGW